MSQKATNLLRVLDHMHAYEREGREIPDDPRIVQRLNQLHHDLAYGDIPEVECPTVIEFVKADEDFPSLCEVEHTFYFYDDNGVLRKIVTGMPFFSKIPSNEALADVRVIGENGYILRHCPAFNIVVACSQWDSPFLDIYSGTVRNGKFNYERYELTEDNLFCDTFEPKPVPDGVWHWICGPHIPTPVNSLDDWHLRNDFYKVLIDTEASFRILKCSPKFEALLTERVPENEMTWKQVGDVLYITGRGKLADSAFYRNSSIRKVVIAPGCTIIGKNAFCCCNQLREVELPEGLLCIGNSAFDCCDQLREVKMPESLRYIGNSAFAQCDQLREVELPEGLLRIGRSAFENCCHNDLKLHIPDNVFEIGEYAFYDVPCIVYNGPGWSDEDWGAESRN